jgi:hypothetical protein
MVCSTYAKNARKQPLSAPFESGVKLRKPVAQSLFEGDGPLPIGAEVLSHLPNIILRIRQ